MNVFFQDLKRVMQRERGLDREEDLYQFLLALKPAVPAALWQKHGLETELRAVRKARKGQ